MNGWLWLHLLGVLLAVGNIVTAAFWKVQADRSGQPAVAHAAARNVMLADYAFTIPGLILIVVSGSMMAERAGMSLTGLNWLTLSLVLFAISGIIWGIFLIPLQRRMIRLSAECVAEGRLSQAYRAASRSWAIYGTIATLLPIVILYLMVMQPHLL
ncbi:DUF2269 domain-containing protein [Paenibacillus soyae]|uniref:DUF2269 domain-containing protein n=1 Tax=Paenibacillus soyae TaxID=2969249 RepID=A0A9X2SA58_9BACL|nr:DUF2269 domain-containing protein [Paenibacillus soyae]MCR2805866.1 DUF2269 domain-containing protein [Paenibacillus soyae]